MIQLLPARLIGGFLVLIFTLNTIVGFACSLGVNMGFNVTHHHAEENKDSKHNHTNGNKHHHEQDDDKNLIHIHADGKEHHHEQEENKALVHAHVDNQKHHHAPINLNKHGKEDDSDNPNCCNDKVVQIAQTDKSTPPSTVLINTIFATAFFSTFYELNVLYLSQTVPEKKYFVRGHHPPIRDIRITIQSFQI